MGFLEWIGGTLQKFGEAVNQGIAGFERATGLDIPLVGTDLSKEKKQITPTFQPQKIEFRPEMTHTTAVPKDYVPVSVPPSPQAKPSFPSPPPTRATAEDVVRAVGTASRMAEEKVKQGGSIGAAMLPEELERRGVKPWEKVEYVPTSYEKVGEEKREIGKIKTEISPTQVTKEIVFSESIPPEEFKRIQDQLKQAGFITAVEVKEGKVYITGTKKAEKGEYFIRPEFLEEVKGEPTKPYFEIEGKKYYLKTDVKPLTEEIPIEATFEIKRPTSYIALVGKDVETIKKAEEAFEKASPLEKTGLYAHTLLSPKGYELIGSLFTPKTTKEVVVERMIELHKSEKPIHQLAIESAIFNPVVEVELAFASGVGVTKLATTGIGARVLGSTAGKVGLIGAGALATGLRGWEIKEKLEKGETEEALGKGIVTAADIGAFMLGTKVASSYYVKPKEIVKIGYTEEKIKPTLKEMPEEDITARIYKKPETTKYIETRPAKEVLEIATKGKVVYSDETIEIRRLGDMYVEIWKEPSGLPKVKAGDVIDVVGVQKQYAGRFHGMDVYVVKGTERPIAFGKPEAEFKPTVLKPEGTPPDILKDVWFIRGLKPKEYYVFRPKELFKLEFWKSLPSKIKAFFSPKTPRTTPTTPSTTVKTIEPTFTAGKLGLGLETEVAKTYYPVAIEITPSTPKTPTLISPTYPETSSTLRPTFEPETTVSKTSFDIVDPLIAGRKAILISPETLGKEQIEASETDAGEILKGAIGKGKFRKTEEELPKRPEQFPIISKIEIEKARRPEEFPVGGLPIQATAERELLIFRRKLVEELKGEEWFRPVAIILPRPRTEYLPGTYSREELGLLPKLELKELFELKTISPFIETPVGVPTKIPSPDIPQGFDIGKFTFGEGGRGKERYEPSLEAIFFGIKAPREKVKIPKKLTGFELRPELI